jgi:hypothetical protein
LAAGVALASCIVFIGASAGAIVRYVCDPCTLYINSNLLK